MMEPLLPDFHETDRFIVDPTQPSSSKEVVRQMIESRLGDRISVAESFSAHAHSERLRTLFREILSEQEEPESYEYRLIGAYQIGDVNVSFHEVSVPGNDLPGPHWLGISELIQPDLRPVRTLCSMPVIYRFEENVHMTDVRPTVCTVREGLVQLRDCLITGYNRYVQYFGREGSVVSHRNQFGELVTRLSNGLFMEDLALSLDDNNTVCCYFTKVHRFEEIERPFYELLEQRGEKLESYITPYTRRARASHLLKIMQSSVDKFINEYDNADTVSMVVPCQTVRVRTEKGWELAVLYDVCGLSAERLMLAESRGRKKIKACPESVGFGLVGIAKVGEDFDRLFASRNFNLEDLPIQSIEFIPLKVKRSSSES